MEEQLISFETAKLAKEKGFNAQVRNYWYNNDKPHVGNCRVEAKFTGGINTKYITYAKNYNSDSEYFISAPTQSLLQKWLREVHNIFIEIQSYSIGYCFVLYKIKKGCFECLETKGGYDLPYEEALEKGLQEALKLIK